MKTILIKFVKAKTACKCGHYSTEEEQSDIVVCDMDDDIAADLIEKQRDSRYVKAGRSKVSVTRLVRTMAYLSGYDRAEFVGAFEVTAAQDCEP